MATNNFEFLIAPVGGELEMTVVVGEALQTARRTSTRKTRIKNEKKERHHADHKHPDLIGPHTPFILVDKGGDSDVVVFKCAQPFVIDVERDDGFDTKGSNPDRSPFGWTTPQVSTPAGGMHQVTGTYAKNNDDTSLHMFYKCTVWSNNLKLDPDFICDR
jgi:hypothetical protein